MRPNLSLVLSGVSSLLWVSFPASHLFRWSADFWFWRKRFLFRCLAAGFSLCVAPYPLVMTAALYPDVPVCLLSPLELFLIRKSFVLRSDCESDP